jgi:hypothetical protein
MTACERKVFPAKVIAHVTAEIENVEGNKPFPKKFFLSETMKRSRLKDTTVSFSGCRNLLILSLVINPKKLTLIFMS